jgi:hypothetical protein
MWAITRAGLCVALVLAVAAPGGAADPSPVPSPSPLPAVSASPATGASAIEFARGRLDAMLSTGHADAAWFSPTFLAQVPAAKIDEVIAKLKSLLGAYRSVAFAGTKFVARFEKGTDDIIAFHLDAANKIDALAFAPPLVALQRGVQHAAVARIVVAR